MYTPTTKVVLSVIGVFLLAAFAGGQDADRSAIEARAEANRKQVEKEFDERRALHADDTDVLVRPGLIASRKHRTVRIFAEASGIRTEEPIEFFLISPNSGKGYEALAASFATASDINDALKFIGMKPGRPVDFQKLRFWPRGERVIMRFSFEKDGRRITVPAESMMWDRNTQQPMPETGFVYVGSFVFKPGDGDGVERFRADFEPGSIASNYNEHTTLLDVPMSARQSAVYSTRTLNPEYELRPATPIEVVMEPEFKDGRTRVLDVTAELKLRPGASGEKLSDFGVSLSTEPGKLIDVSAFGDAARQWIKDGKDAFVTVVCDPAMTLSSCRNLSLILRAMQDEALIRVEPPAAGQLYFEAFLPDERLRKMENRSFQPWEVHLSFEDGRVRGFFREITDRVVAGTEESRLIVSDTALHSPDDLKRLLGAPQRVEEYRPVAIFAPDTMTYGQLMDFAGPALKPETVVFVFLPAPATRPGN